MERQNENESANPQRISLSAWLISSGVHLSLLILCVLFLRCDRPAISDEADRPVAIMLTQRQQERTDYFSDEASDASSSSRVLAAETSDVAAEMASPADMPPPLIPGLELPHRTASDTSSRAPVGLDSLPMGGGPRGRP